MSADVLPGISERTVETPRLRTYLLSRGSEGGTPVVFIHGNVSSSLFFQDTLLALPDGYLGLAPDMRGYGESEPKAVDATRGLRDFSDDLRSLFETLGLTGARKPHLVGWSMGGGVIQQYAIDHAGDVASLTLIDPVSPFGFGGTKDAQGTPCYPDFAGSGGGTANPDYVKRLSEGDRSEESPNSPLNVMNTFYFKPPFRVTPDREQIFMDSMLKMQVSDGAYPGDTQTSENWPNVRPGTQGFNNALSPAYLDLSAFAGISPKLPVLWLRGADDQIVSDTSFLDFGTLGSLGYVPGWPGADVFPSQPMVSQIRYVLDTYRKNGGSYTEIVVADSGHAPLIEKPDVFRQRLFAFITAQG